MLNINIEIVSGNHCIISSGSKSVVVDECMDGYVVKEVDGLIISFHKQFLEALGSAVIFMES